jgi:dTDP-4-dehydrorhamnose reductase
MSKQPTRTQNQRFLIAGASGQLGQSFALACKARGLQVDAPQESEFNITSPTAVEEAFARYHPTVLINCAAYNNVDGGEAMPEPAYAVNRDAVATLAAACQRHGAKLVHYGTDYVFDGQTDRPYTEEDRPNPLNVYGASKLAGEQAALANASTLVLRVSWVYGPGTQNFLYKLKQWSEGRDTLQVVADQIATPTYTEDIVSTTFEALSMGLTGLYHLVNHGHASRIDVAQTYFNSIDRKIELTPVPTSHFPSPAQRPLFSALSAAKLEAALGHPLPSWQDAIARYCDQ